MKQGKNQLGNQHSIKISTDPHAGNGKDHKANADAHSRNIVEKTGIWSAKPVHNAFQGGVGIKKRADKRQRFYVHSRSLTVKQKNSKRLSKKKEKQSAESPEEKTGSKYRCTGKGWKNYAELRK